jgi:hypothetical protein
MNSRGIIFNERVFVGDLSIFDSQGARRFFIIRFFICDIVSEYQRS